MTTKICVKCEQEKAIDCFRIENKKTGLRRKECKDCYRQYQREWREQNREKVKAYTAEWHKQNPGKSRQYMNDWRKKNPERDKEHGLKYRTTHAEKVKETRRNSWLKDRESYRMKERAYRARKKAVQCDLSRKEWLALIEAYGKRCAYCGKKTELVTMDHVIPITKGGAHTLSNVVPACKSCNSRKCNRTLEEAGMTFVLNIEFVPKDNHHDIAARTDS